MNLHQREAVKKAFSPLVNINIPTKEHTESICVWCIAYSGRYASASQSYIGWLSYVNKFQEKFVPRQKLEDEFNKIHSHYDNRTVMELGLPVTVSLHQDKNPLYWCEGMPLTIAKFIPENQHLTLGGYVRKYLLSKYVKAPSGIYDKSVIRWYRCHRIEIIDSLRRGGYSALMDDGLLQLLSLLHLQEVKSIVRKRMDSDLPYQHYLKYLEKD